MSSLKLKLFLETQFDSHVHMLPLPIFFFNVSKIAYKKFYMYISTTYVHSSSFMKKTVLFAVYLKKRKII
jgi:hypothetical protein